MPEPDYRRAREAADIKGLTLAEFVRGAMRDRANRVLAAYEREHGTAASAAA